jgi:Fe-S-cluster containining protein
MNAEHDSDNFFTEFDATFFADGYKIAKACLQEGLSQNGILNICEHLYYSIDQLMVSFAGHCSRNKLPVACRKGCSSCCHQSVFVLPYEIFFVVHFIEKNLPEEITDEIREATALKSIRTGRMKMQQLLHFKEACPLLDDTGQCSAYIARPMACRIYLSSDVSTCINDLENPDDTKHFPSLYEFPLRAGRMLNEGVCTYLNERKIDPYEWIFESSLNKVFEDSQAFRKWIDGVNLFQAREVSFEEVEYLQRFEITRKDNCVK